MGLVPLKDGSFLISERDARKIVSVKDGSRSTVRTIDEADPAARADYSVWPLPPDEKDGLRLLHSRR
jgi:hypothetical protein